MFRKSLQPKNLLKSALAVVFMLTLSGAYNLFCCQQMFAAEIKPEHCPLSKTVKSEHCQFSKNKPTETSSAVTSVNLFECCALKFNVFVATLEKNEFPQKTPVVVDNSFNFFPKSVRLESKTGLTDFSYRPRVLAGSDLHIRNCVFRI